MWLVIKLLIAVWVIDSIVDPLIFEEGTFISHLLTPSAHEVFVRLLLIGILLFAVYNRTLLAKQKAVQHTAQESEERYRTLFENAHDMIQSVAPDGSFIFVNPSWIKKLGYTQEDLKTITMFDIIHPDCRDHCTAAFKRVMSGEAVNNIEATFISKNGRKIEVEGNVNVRSVDGKVIATQGIFRDITRRKKAEGQLAGLLKDVTRAKTEWEITFNNSMEIIILLDKDLNIIKHNKRFADFVELPPQELLGRKCYDFFTCNPTETGHCLGKIHDGELREWTEVKTNSGHWFYISHCPIFDENGKFLHSIVIASDVTSLKNTQQRLQDSEEELDSLFVNFVKAMVNALDAKSPWTKGHSERVAGYAEQIAKEMGLEDEKIILLRLASLLHDIGKIGTYDYLLDKPESLTEEEFEAVKKHPDQGTAILKGVKQLKDILPLIRYHHERIDGKGYPEGLKGEEIPLCARILHVADSFDSMTADRPYRSSPGKEYAISELKRCNGTRFDTRVVEAFLKILSNS